MVDEARSRAGKKGVAIKTAKHEAAAENKHVVLEQYGVIVTPAGVVLDIAEMRQNDPPAEEGAQQIEDAEVDAALSSEQQAQVDEEEHAGLKGDRMAAPHAGTPVEEVIDPPAEPMTATEINRRMGRPDDWRPAGGLEPMVLAEGGA